MNNPENKSHILKPKKLARTAVLLLLCAAMMNTLAPARIEVSAASGSSQFSNDSKVQSLQDKMNKLNSDLKTVKGNLAAASSSISDALSYKTQLDRELTLLLDKIDLQNEYIEALEESIQKKTLEISDKQTEYDEKYEIFKERLRVTYEDGDASYLAMLFGAESLSDFLSRVDRIGEMLEYDAKIMDSLKDEKSSLVDQKDELEDMKTEQEAVAAQLELDKAAIKQKSEENEQYLTNLKKASANYAAAQEDLEKQIAESEAQLEARIKELEEEQKKLNSKYVGGTLLWPVPTQYTRITSECGWRTSPFTGKPEYHNGVDIPVPYGTEIYAANDGTVVTATEHWSYGNYIMIDHGGGIYTLYAHNSKLLVKVGDKVKRGQVIAKAGSTGASTGNHCHFSIRVNGEWVNHRAYFPD